MPVLMLFVIKIEKKDFSEYVGIREHPLSFLDEKLLEDIVRHAKRRQCRQQAGPYPKYLTL